MKLDEAKNRFIQTWGTFATQWGINRTMAQIHALLMVSPKSMNADEVMEALQISRGNSNMNLRDLIDWGLIYRQVVAGDRKEYFVAEKDVWKIARQVAKERRRREIEPVIGILADLKNVETDSPEAEEFKRMLTEIHQVAGFANNSLEALIKAEENWLLGSFLNMFK